jgi:hypothetical protein
MEHDSLEETTADSVQASKAHLPSRTSWGCQTSAHAPTPPDEISGGTAMSHTEGDPREARQEDRRYRRGQSTDAPQRLALVNTLRFGQKAKPVRRVWIPTPDTIEQRPLGIPVMADRALQALVKSALEHAWEARFEPNSDGFRPGRSCHDAIEAMFTAIGHKAT